MSNRPSALSYTIASGQTVGTAVTINQGDGFKGRAVVGVVLPAAMTGTKVTIQADYGDGTLRNVADSAAAAEEITFGADLNVWLDPAITAGAQELALLSNAAEAADRTFQILIREVQ